MRAFAVLVLLVVLATACGDATVTGTGPPPSVRDGQLDALASARERWASAAPEDYTLSESSSCAGCTPHQRTLAVRRGEVVSLASSDQATVEDVFDTIERSLRDGATVEVEYDEKLGYPKRVVIDLEGDGTPDVELVYSDLAAMPIVASLEELLAARAKWEALRLDSYRYVLRADCTCPEGGTFEIEVRNGRVESVTPLDDAARASSIHPGPLDDAFDDLETWFTDSADLIEEGILAVEVRMDPDLGYPRWFRIDADIGGDEPFSGPLQMVITIDLVPLATPGGEPEPPPGDDAADRLREAKAVWDSAGLTDYRFVVTVHCECPPEVAGPFEITVRNGKFWSAGWQGGETPADPEPITIEDAFDVIATAIAAGTEVLVSYDPTYGHPLDVVIDPAAVAVDGGLAFSITAFTPLERLGFIRGTALAGPQCPVLRDPPEPACEDKPVAGAAISITWPPSKVVIPVTTSEGGVFFIALDPGVYVVTAQPVDGLLGTPEPVEVTVVAARTTEIELAYDTGIR